jgi:hypothetical protein
MHRPKNKYTLLTISTLYVIVALFMCPQNTQAGTKPLAVDVVFTLDLSGSTNGLIDDVRDKIWDMNNEIRRLSPEISLRFAVVGYSRPSFGDKNQLVKVISPFTNNIDLICSELYKIRPNIEKGDQYVGAAIRASIDLLQWSNDKDAIKQLFLVGNGSVFLGGFSVKESCELAKEKGISIHAFYCSSSLRAREIDGWTKIADATGGVALDIKIHKRLSDYSTSGNFDKLRHLADELCKTYIYYGKEGQANYKLMASNDKNALQSGKGTYEAMMVYKISDAYQGKQSSWDLIDYVKSRKFDLKNIDSTTLPDSLKKSSPEQLLTKLLQIKDRRNVIVSQIRQLLPYDRQNQVNAFYATKSDESRMILDREVMKILYEKLEKNGIALN